MRTRWSQEAVTQFEEIVDYLQDDSASAAQRIAKLIFERIESLRNMPGMGRAGAVPGTRELVIASTGYIVTYEVHDEVIAVLRIRHGAREALQP